MGKTEIIGDYNFVSEGIDAEGILRVTLQPIDLMTYWKRCGLIADFGAKFYAYAYGKNNEIIENTISTVLNELVENAAKFSKQRDSYVEIVLKHYINLVSIEVANEATPRISESFRNYVRQLAESDHEELYFKKLEEKAEDDTSSGLGLLMILKDYPCRFGAKFEEMQDGGSSYYKIHVKIIMKLEE
jgi:hypothetical protein